MLRLLALFPGLAGATGDTGAWSCPYNRVWDATWTAADGCVSNETMAESCGGECPDLATFLANGSAWDVSTTPCEDGSHVVQVRGAESATSYYFDPTNQLVGTYYRCWGLCTPACCGWGGPTYATLVTGTPLDCIVSTPEAEDTRTSSPESRPGCGCRSGSGGAGEAAFLLLLLGMRRHDRGAGARTW